MTVDIRGRGTNVAARRDRDGVPARVPVRNGEQNGLLTVPAVRVVDQLEVVRDPLTAVDSTRVVSLAMDTDVDTVSEWRKRGSETLLGTETTRTTATATLNGTERNSPNSRPCRRGSVTAIATISDDAAPPFGAVTRDA